MEVMKVSEIAEVAGGKVYPGNGHDPVVWDLLIDSRRLIRPEGTLFIALVTSRNDGHQFIGELYEKGVRIFLVSSEEYFGSHNLEPGSEKRSANSEWRIENSRERSANSEWRIAISENLATFILVPDTLEALQSLAAYHRSRFSFPVIGITGSNGKTIVKEWLYQLLSSGINIIRSPKSYNSQIGVPLSVWKMEAVHQLAIFEAGISRPGEMEKLEKIIRPEFGIITNIGHAHDEHFASAIQKTDEKLRLFRNSRLLVYCSDYEEIDNCVKFYDPSRTFRPFSWSRSKQADLRINEVRKTGSGTVIEAVYKGEAHAFSIPFADDASIENAIHCYALLTAISEYKPEYAGSGNGAEISSTLERAVREAISDSRFATLAPIAMRLELKEAINRCSLINDSYNSDINSLSIALDFLTQQNQHRKKTVILSDILQSGRDKNELYREISALLGSKGIDKLIGIGRDMNKYADKFHMTKSFYHTTDDFLMHYPLSSFQDEAILLKGARLFEFERISNVLQRKAHETVLEINLDAMIHNLNHYRAMLKPGVKMMVMVKAFSYGSGSFEIANLLQFHHADYLAVAYADEGVELRKAGIRLPIMVMSPDEHSLDTLLRYNLEPEIYNLHIFSLLEEVVKRNQTSGQEAVRIHIKLDTGMHRLGFQKDELDGLLKRLTGGSNGAFKEANSDWRTANRGVNGEDGSSSRIRVVSVFSHLAASEDPSEDEFTKEQIRLFDAMSSEIISSIGYPVLRHILNSAGISRFPEAQFDMVRLGIGLYGVGYNAPEQKKLRNVSALRTVIVQIKTIQKGETIGYNRRGKAMQESRIAVIPIGYADGLDRRLGNGAGRVYIHGNPATIIGNVCMDLSMVDVTGLDVNEGDEVVVFDDAHPVSELSAVTVTIPYEVMTGISGRVKRIYFHE